MASLTTHTTIKSLNRGGLACWKWWYGLEVATRLVQVSPLHPPRSWAGESGGIVARMLIYLLDVFLIRLTDSVKVEVMVCVTWEWYG